MPDAIEADIPRTPSSRCLDEYLPRYEDVRTVADPDALPRAFLRSTYDAAAERDGWDRAALER